jgi:uncharacterized repeat protein (TIGR03803 family)
MKAALALLAATTILVSPALRGQTGNIESGHHLAWAENAGWFDFRPPHGGGEVLQTYLRGYAWLENIGWVKLGSGTGPYLNTTASNWGINRNPTTGALTGFAWAENAGWIRFDPQDGGVILDPASLEWTGFAWAENLGWIHIRSATPVAYGVAVARPVAVATVNPTAICKGEIALLDGSGSYHPNSGVSIVSYLWESSAGGTSSGAFVSVSPTVDTTYSLAVQDNYGTFSANASQVLLAALPMPTTAIVGGSQSIPVSGTTAGLGGSIPLSGTGRWSVESGGSGDFSPAESAPNATFTHTGGAGPVVLRWTISLGSCSSSAQLMVAVGSPQLLSVAAVGPGSGTVTSNPAGISCPGTCRAVFPWGTPVTLTSTSSVGSELASWSGDCGGPGSCAFTMNGPKAVVAGFKLAGDSYTVRHHMVRARLDGQQASRSYPVTDGTYLYSTAAFGGLHGHGVVFRTRPDGSDYTLLHAFAGGPADGANPYDSVTVVGGVIYGTTWLGGASNHGTVFRVSMDGSGYSVLHSFSGADGLNPNGPLLESGGALYGTTWGGTTNFGTVFKLKTDGSDFLVLRAFTGGFPDGRSSRGSLVELGGVLYGTTRAGGSAGFGTIFRINPDGSDYARIHEFAGGSMGQSPEGTLTELDGVLFGTTTQGGSGSGTVFRVNTSGSGFLVIRSFTSGSDGVMPDGTLTALGGVLYGTTSGGGAAAGGTVYRLNPNGSGYTILRSFTGGASDGSAPTSAVSELGGVLYGMTQFGGFSGTGTVFRLNPDGSGFGLVHSFASSPDDAAVPESSTLLAIEGVLYGMSRRGGTRDRGTIFRMKVDGSELAVLRSFEGYPGDGAYPSGSLTEVGGVLYGMTLDGGASDRGTIFRVNRDGSAYTVLHSFTGGASGGADPYGSLTQFEGALYGMTHGGGPQNRGTIFRIELNGTGFAVVHAFAGGTADGQYPFGSLVRVGNALYGMTSSGGASTIGTVFKLDLGSPGFSLLRSFGGSSTGFRPYGSLIEFAGVLYGMTNGGGTYNYGAIFKINPDGTGYSVLHSLYGTAASDGARPSGSLIEAGGLLFGVTSEGGSKDGGVIFLLEPGFGFHSVLHSFTGRHSNGLARDDGDGLSPYYGSLTKVGDSLYGMTRWGGTAGSGVIFSMKVMYSISGTVRVNGVGLAGVTMNGLPGNPATNAAGQYTASVPTYWSGTVTPRLDGYTFTPSSRTHTYVEADLLDIDYSAEVEVCDPPSTPAVLSTSAVPGFCGMRLSWSASSSGCGIPITYTIHRSQTPGFVPGGSTRIASCVTGTTYDDAAVAGTYYYRVQAEAGDTGGTGACNGGSVSGLSPEASGDTSCSPPPPQPFEVFAATSRYGEVHLQWVNPDAGCPLMAFEAAIRYRTNGDYPATRTDGTGIAVAGQVCGESRKGSVLHGSLTNDTIHRYSAFVEGADGEWSGRKTSWSRPFDSVASRVKWAYTTGASAMAQPGVSIAPGASSVLVVSNDRILHSLGGGATGGEWPPAFVPQPMNAPSQAWPGVVPGMTDVVGVDRVAFVSSQDGRIYASDVATGASIWASSTPIGEALQGAVAGVFARFGGPAGVNRLFVGTRNVATANEIVGIEAASGNIAWRFDNGGEANSIGIVSAMPAVEYPSGRVFLTSRAGGSSSTLWCLAHTGTACTGWTSPALGDIDSSPNVRSGSVYVGNNSGQIYRINAANGSTVWGPVATNTGPVRTGLWVDLAADRIYFSTSSHLWSLVASTGAAVAGWPVALTSPSYPVKIGGKVYVGAGNGRLYQVDASTGLIDASVVLGDGSAAVGIPTYNSLEGTFYVGTEAGVIYAVQEPLQ